MEAGPQDNQNADQAMEFQVDTNLEADQLFHEQADNSHPPDSELLAIQKRKSMPKVVIEEFV